MTEVNAFGYEACYASYKGGEGWRQGMLKVRNGGTDGRGKEERTGAYE